MKRLNAHSGLALALLAVLLFVGSPAKACAFHFLLADPALFNWLFGSDEAAPARDLGKEPLARRPVEKRRTGGPQTFPPASDWGRVFAPSDQRDLFSRMCTRTGRHRSTGFRSVGSLRADDLPLAAAGAFAAARGEAASRFGGLSLEARRRAARTIGGGSTSPPSNHPILRMIGGRRGIGGDNQLVLSRSSSGAAD